MQRKYIIASIIALLCLEGFGPCKARFDRAARNGTHGRVIDPTTPRDGGVR